MAILFGDYLMAIIPPPELLCALELFCAELLCASILFGDYLMAIFPLPGILGGSINCSLGLYIPSI